MCRGDVMHSGNSRCATSRVSEIVRSIYGGCKLAGGVVSAGCIFPHVVGS